MKADALVVGAGPAGLMAAEALARAGRRVLVAEAKPSIGRKFLMAGKSGLNLTKDEDPRIFRAAFQPPGRLDPMLAAFGPAEAMVWARGLGQEVFTGSTGRVFPRVMKASPLLRAWALRLAEQEVEVRTRWRWLGIAHHAHRFATPEGEMSVTAGVSVVAFGGGSWARLGSDGAWVGPLRAAGVEVRDFAPANMGFGMAWSPHMARHFGQPVKGAALCLPDGTRERGEFVLSAQGLEGGGIYAVSRALRDGAGLHIDLLADQTVHSLATRLVRMGTGTSLSNRLRKLGLSPAAAALAQELGRPLPSDPAVLAARLKALPIPLGPPRPLDEAISTAGGVAWDSVTEGLELKVLPGTFVCGEMLDWEAPTGGYLLTACLATGLGAGRHAAAVLHGDRD